MLKKLLDGFIFGTGFGVAFVLIWVVALYGIFPNLSSSKIETSKVISSDRIILDEAPPIKHAKKFLGSTGAYSEEFEARNSSTLSSGNGVIVGKALVNNKPLEGLKLRLALNGSVYSQWATTDTKGIYRVSVPFGEYVIDGFEFDTKVAHKVLPNKINHPEFVRFGEKFVVSKDEEGPGTTFRFVDPIVKKLDKKTYAKNEKVILKWSPYPEASDYTLQVHEKPDATSWQTKHLFRWPDRPSVSEPQLDLSKFEKLKLKPGYYYTFEVQAKNARGSLLSTTHQNYQGYDFKISE